MMNIEWIETYLDLMESGNFKLTAENLGLTQSTVSHRIQKLEAALGEKLFERGRGGAVANAAGERFFPFAQALRFEWNNARQQFKPRKTKRKPLRIGIQYDFAKTHAGRVLEITRQQFPDSSIYVEVDYSQQMTRDVERGELDFALIYTPSQKPDLILEPLGELDYLMIAKTQIALKDLTGADYTFPNISPTFASLHEQVLPQLHDAHLQCGQSDAIVQFLEQLGGASYVIAQLAGELIAKGQFVAIAEAPTLKQQLYFCTHIRKRSKLPLRKLIQDIKAIL